MSTAQPTGLIPPLFTGFIDDAAVFPPGSATLPDALREHLEHRSRWYASLVGPLLVKTSQLGELVALLDGVPEPPSVGVVADTGLAPLPGALAALPAGVRVAQLEIPVAKRGEDPLPGIAALSKAVGDPDGGLAGVTVYAEVPLTLGLHAALDRLTGTGIVPKFRVGGLLAELFPTPDELGAVISACADRGLDLKLTAGLHHAVRHTDRATGFTHHGFLNVLLACVRAARGAGRGEVVGALRHTDPRPLVDVTYELRDRPRPLWAGFGSCSVTEPLDDLIGLGLIEEPAA